MIKATIPLIRVLVLVLVVVVVVAPAGTLLSGNRGSVFAHAVGINPDVQDTIPAPPSVVPWDDKHRALAGSASKCYLSNPQNCDPCFYTKSCCMQSYYEIYDGSSNALTCVAQNIKFLQVDSFSVSDAEAKPCNCDCVETGCQACSITSNPVSCKEVGVTRTYRKGTVIGACRGTDDEVTVQVGMSIVVSNSEYDVGLYVNTNGGSAITGSQCIVAGLANINPTSNEPYRNANNEIMVGLLAPTSGNNTCYDFLAAGTLVNYQFSAITLACKDTSSPSDGYLDFNVATSFSSVSTCSYNGTLPFTLPYPTASSKCWGGSSGTSFTLDIAVPPYRMPSSNPSGNPSSNPSSGPSLSKNPSSNPSSRPSRNPSSNPSGNPSSKPSSRPSRNPSSNPSGNPSSNPSSRPSTSRNPSSNPSGNPSSNPSSRPSRNPSSNPSGNPSSNPSSRPSRNPSSNPSGNPSSNPSISSAPSRSSQYPSFMPSISSNPSGNPSSSSRPSRNPSSNPSGNPSSNPSSRPSRNPSSNPSGNPSSNPSISSAPSRSTKYPSFAPSTSQDPTGSPSSEPSISKNPSMSPTSNPSSNPSAPPTGSLYYPDWQNGEQKCVNDGRDPAFMLQLQRDNYLYRSKEECCQKHFWWRIAQCMENEHPVWSSNGNSCELTTNLDPWEVKYTPQTWDTADLFETLQECCIAKFWWDVDGCKAASPKELMFEFDFNAKALILPRSCQDADIMGSVLEVAMNSGFGVEVTSVVTKLGCVTLLRNQDTSNTECGGCLAGSQYDGGTDGTRDPSYYNIANFVNITTNIVVQVTAECAASQCPDAASMTNLYNLMVNNFNPYLSSGEFQSKIRSWATERVPPVPDLFEVQILGTSFNTDGTFENPMADPEATVEALSITMYGHLSVTGLDTSSFTSAQEKQAKADFENAIISIVGPGLPQGSSVKVLSMNTDRRLAAAGRRAAAAAGEVKYVITLVGVGTSADATSAATAAISSLDSALVDVSNLIAQNLPGVTVVSNTLGTTTESAVATVKSSGQLSTSLNGMSLQQKAQVSEYFESAIAATLLAEGALPEGAYVTVNTISDTGVVSYTITMNLDPDADNAIIVNAITSELSSGLTLAAISNAVASDAARAATGTLPSAVLTVNISGFTPGKSIGVSFKPWYPDWTTDGRYCVNDGNAPSFMKKPDVVKDYMFTTQKECCESWFVYATDCVKGLEKPVLKFYPDFPNGGCSKKLSNQLKKWEIAYDTLEQCCDDRFNDKKAICCDSPGMGGCGNSGEIVYLPNWKENKCFSQNKILLTKSDQEWAERTQELCCAKYFNWASASERKACYNT